MSDVGVPAPTITCDSSAESDIPWISVDAASGSGTTRIARPESTCHVASSHRRPSPRRIASRREPSREKRNAAGRGPASMRLALPSEATRWTPPSSIVCPIHDPLGDQSVVPPPPSASNPASTVGEPPPTGAFTSSHRFFMRRRSHAAEGEAGGSHQLCQGRADRRGVLARAWQPTTLLMTAAVSAPRPMARSMSRSPLEAVAM